MAPVAMLLTLHIAAVMVAATSAVAAVTLKAAEAAHLEEVVASLKVTTMEAVVDTTKAAAEASKVDMVAVGKTTTSPAASYVARPATLFRSDGCASTQTSPG